MPSSRDSRKQLKWGSQVDAQEKLLHGDLDAPSDPKRWSPEQRQAKARMRRRLAGQYQSLDHAACLQRRAEFRREVRKLCQDDKQFESAWEASFAPRLRAAQRKLGKQPKQSAPKTPSSGRSAKRKPAPVVIRHLGQVSRKAPTNWDEREDARRPKGGGEADHP